MFFLRFSDNLRNFDTSQIDDDDLSVWSIVEKFHWKAGRVPAKLARDNGFQLDGEVVSVLNDDDDDDYWVWECERGMRYDGELKKSAEV